MDIFPPAKPTVLILENSPASLARLGDWLHLDYTVKAISQGRSVAQVCIEEQPDLILIDLMRSGNDGLEVCRRLKASEFTRRIPVIFLTNESSVAFQKTLFEVGAVDYITRPICPPTLLSRIKSQLAVAAHARSEHTHQEFLAYGEGQHKKQLNALQEMTLVALASLAETRDTETGNHLRRTQHYVLALGQYLSLNPRFSDYLTLERLSILFKCAPLHDIGKVGIPDNILLKPGRYEPAEFEVMKMHPRLGRDAILNAQTLVGDHSEFLEVAKEIVYSHHEKWDGTGYPQGLVGDAIPIPARLMALADVYDALISRRVYKSGMSHAQAAQLILEGRGQHFDPDVVDAFVALSDVFQGIASRFTDTDDDLKAKADLVSRLH